MSRSIHLTALGLVAALLACTVSVPSIQRVSGSGRIVTINEDLADFDHVVIGHAFVATVRQGESFSVVIRIDDNLQPYVQARVEAGTLRIGLDTESVMNLATGTLEAEVAMPALTGIEASGASRVNLSGFDTQADVSLEASGASTLTGDIHSGDATIEASGASTITLTGSGGDLMLEVSGASSADLEEFPVSAVSAVLSGASHGVVNTDGTIDVEASGASRLLYVGSPTLGNVDTSGASSVSEK